MNEIVNRLQALRQAMQKENVDFCWIPNADDHLSDEYTAPYFQAMQYFSGFTGDYGSLVVGRKWAGLWTDGRNFTQAENELAGSGVELMRMGQEGVPTVETYLLTQVPKGGTLAFDGRMVSAAQARQLASGLAERGASVRLDLDLPGQVWNSRPAMPAGRLFTLAQKYTGVSAGEKIRRVRQAMQECGADVLLLTELEDPCWLLNIRGRDLACTPVAYSFVLLDARRTVFYIEESKLTAAVRQALKDARVTIRSYESFARDLSRLKKRTIWVSLKKLNAALYGCLDASNRILDRPSPILAMRGQKNAVEIRSTRQAHLKDGLAMVHFLYWLKSTVGKEDLNEYQIQTRLDQLRAEQEGFLCPSFETICAYGPNAAMMHYTATAEKHSPVKAKGFLLVDSGGTYRDGSTDITRTIVLGRLSAQEKMYYTKVLQGNLQLARARFLAGSNGYNLDILARGPLWQMNLDYQCATGHGVGHVLSVHEGPFAIRWGYRLRDTAPFVPGNIVSDEPGVYLPGRLGIRIENELLVVPSEKNFYGQFLQFEVLTCCPIDLDGIDPRCLNQEDKEQLNAYHAWVWRSLSPYLVGKEKAWLKEATRKLK